jgi:hypothetical protein
MTEQAPSQENPPRPTPERPANRAAAGQTFADAEKPLEDLSSEIIKQLPRTAGDRVTCRRILGDRYRANWWAPQETNAYDNPAMAGLTVTTHRVRKSEWLQVTKTGSSLTIKSSSRS